MIVSENNKLYFKCSGKELTFSVVCEVGVYMPETSNILKFIHHGTKAILVEPDKRSLARIYKMFKDKNVVVYPYAIYDYNGTLELVQREASSFAKDLPSSPAQVNDNYTINKQDTFIVECKVFHDIDPGNIDLLSVDTEGCEWYIMKNLVSRPKIISLETHGKFYTNPFIHEIRNWMEQNHYCIWYKTKSDTIYYKKDVMKTSGIEKIELLCMNYYIGLRRLKKFFYKK